jgi:anaerobic selenocysteine-containing dehydrogenase
VALLNFAVHNVANYSAPVLPLDTDESGERSLDEWEIMLRLAGVVSGLGVHADVDEPVRAAARAMLAGAARDEYGNVHGRDVDEMEAMLGERRGPERLLDVMLRTGPYGDGFGANPDGLTLAVLEANPHGVDLGALEPGRIPDLLRTPSGRIELLPPVLVADVARLAASLERDPDASMVLVGRRHVRSNNSWMHNIRVLTKGRNRCTMQIHPDDAARLGIADGSPARVASRVGEVIVTAELFDGIRPGVVSIPHGFGQALPGVQLRVAGEYRGVNTNVLTDEQFFDPLSGNIALNGVPVTVASAS